MLPELLELLPDCLWRRLLRWSGATDETIAWMFEDDEEETADSGS